MTTDTTVVPPEVFRRIKKWNPSDLHGLMKYIKYYWKYAYSGFWSEVGDTYKLSTAGWSDNESIIAAMQSNYVFWATFWESSRRGGHYVFSPTGFVGGLRNSNGEK